MACEMDGTNVIMFYLLLIGLKKIEYLMKIRHYVHSLNLLNDGSIQVLRAFRPITLDWCRVCLTAFLTIELLEAVVESNLTAFNAQTH